mmetsp:Transcript_15873/g.44948  ORF Transcript_15873/g.44948 Transcript_15873/m.44948 type:complete len:92 (-) Transcript_15873:273-548(-)
MHEYYPSTWPTLGVQTFRIGKLEMHLGKDEKVACTLTAAIDILKITHGKEHDITKRAVESLWKYRILFDSSVDIPTQTSGRYQEGLTLESE